MSLQVFCKVQKVDFSCWLQVVQGLCVFPKKRASDVTLSTSRGADAVSVKRQQKLHCAHTARSPPLATGLNFKWQAFLTPNAFLSEVLSLLIAEKKEELLSNVKPIHSSVFYAKNVTWRIHIIKLVLLAFLRSEPRAENYSLCRSKMNSRDNSKKKGPSSSLFWVFLARWLI